MYPYNIFKASLKFHFFFNATHFETLYGIWFYLWSRKQMFLLFLLLFYKGRTKNNHDLSLLLPSSRSDKAKLRKQFWKFFFLSGSFASREMLRVLHLACSECRDFSQSSFCFSIQYLQHASIWGINYSFAICLSFSVQFSIYAQCYRFISFKHLITKNYPVSWP